MRYQHIIYEPGPIARIKLNRPRYYNAQSRIMLDEMDDAFARAVSDEQVKVMVLSGEGKHFSVGHDLGTPEELEDRSLKNWDKDSEERYTELKRRFVEMGLRWRELKKPTIAMVHGYCIFGGWMIAATMDILFAAEDALFLPSHFQYLSTPWDIGSKKAKEILFEHRFMTAPEALTRGFVNRIYPADKLEEETMAFAHNVAANDPFRLSLIKQSINHMMDVMGFRNEIEAAYQSYYIQESMQRKKRESTSQRDAKTPNLARVDEALKNLESSQRRLRIFE